MSISLDLNQEGVLQPKIVVLGIGGAGGNAVNNMINSGLKGVEFWAANTDAQALRHSISSNKIQLGVESTQGLGAGSNPGIGKVAAEESWELVANALRDTNMVFITAGMGGGTGTGAAPTIARIAKEMGILTVGVVTKPFHFEGMRRRKIAELGLEEMEKYVDTLIVIPNQNLFRVANEKTTFADAFKLADRILDSGVRGVTDLITMPGVINLDFADIRAVMSEMGKAMMGTGEADGENRAIRAAEAAISNPLLDNSSMKGAQGVLINITGSEDMTLFEVDEAANRVREEVDPEANIIFGSAFNAELDGKIRVSIVATGIDENVHHKHSHLAQNYDFNTSGIKTYNGNLANKNETTQTPLKATENPTKIQTPIETPTNSKPEDKNYNQTQISNESPNSHKIEQTGTYFTGANQTDLAANYQQITSKNIHNIETLSNLKFGEQNESLDEADSKLKNMPADMEQKIALAKLNFQNKNLEMAEEFQTANFIHNKQNTSANKEKTTPDHNTNQSHIGKSLLERMAMSFSKISNNDSTTKSTDEKIQRDLLDIPAFLRKNNNK